MKGYFRETKVEWLIEVGTFLLCVTAIATYFIFT